jgi:hypothetical protein
MKNKIELFQRDIQAITKEMNVLLKYLPAKDSVIQIQKEKILEQMHQVQAEITRNRNSAEEQKRLIEKLSDLRNQVEQLNLAAQEKANSASVIQQAEATPVAYVQAVKNDTLLLQAKEAEIAKLKSTIADLQAKEPSVIVQNKLAMYYFTTVSSDKKQRANKTKSLILQFQLKGNIAELHDKYLYIEVRDPFHRIISGSQDKVRVTNHFVSEYKFEPFNYAFVKGKYSVKLYSQEAQFQSVTFLTLN